MQYRDVTEVVAAQCEHVTAGLGGQEAREDWCHRAGCDARSPEHVTLDVATAMISALVAELASRREQAPADMWAEFTLAIARLEGS